MSPVAVAAPSHVAAEAAAFVAERGGGAVDAAVAAAIAAMVSEPGLVAPGAGAFVTIWPAAGTPTVYDGYMAVAGIAGRHPEPVEHEVTMAYGGGVTTIVGPASIAVPGAWAAFGAAHAEHGGVTWTDVVSPAVALAAQGTPLGPTSAHYLEHAREPVFDRDPAGRRALRSDSGPLQTGELVVVEGLADSLQRIAELGAADLYTGELARRVADDLRDRGSHLGRADLASYRVHRRKPLEISLGDWVLATNPAPAVGGAALAAMLTLSASGRIDDLLEAQHRVYSWRRSEVDKGAARDIHIADFLAGLAGDPIRSPSTAHVSAAGGGTVCAITLSAGYGSGVIPTGTGMWMNNGLGEVELVGDRNLLAPGTRLNSNMAPTVGRHVDGRALAIGSPGADRITSAIAQTLLHLESGAAPAEAIRAPRVHVDVGEEVTIAHEPGVAIPETQARLRPFDGLHMYFGGVGLAIHHPDGSVTAATDPRRNGATVTR